MVQISAFPSFELSYESNQPHKTVVSATNDIIIQMPQGRRFYVWFTVDTETGDHAIYHVTPDRTSCEKQQGILNGGTTYPLHLFFGTVVTAFQISPRTLVMTDLHVYRGVPVSTVVNQSVKWAWMTTDIATHASCKYVLPVWRHSSQGVAPLPGYKVHHMQRRSWDTLSPYVHMPHEEPTLRVESNGRSLAVETNGRSLANESNGRSLANESNGRSLAVDSKSCLQTKQFKKPQYSQVTTFWLMADGQYDLYRLYGYGGAQEPEAFVDFACVVDLRTSKWLNGLFRRMKENRSLDAIEESDDEEDFEDVRLHKYTDMERRVKVKCRFQPRLRKWVPVEEDRPNAPVVALHRL